MEYDDFQGKISEEFSLEQFPSPEKLKGLYEKSKGFSLGDVLAKALFVPYQGGQAANPNIKEKDLPKPEELIRIIEKSQQNIGESLGKLKDMLKSG